MDANQTTIDEFTAAFGGRLLRDSGRAADR